VGRIVNKYWAGAFGGCIALIIASASVASPRSIENLSFGVGRPVPPGNVLTGQDTFNAVCWACHSRDLNGGRAPPLTGSTFYKIWQGRRVDALSDLIRNTMPKDDPGSLSEPMARDLVAYIVAHSNNPANLTDGPTRK
jgi:mono/diheme cytochrome c family protein